MEDNNILQSVKKRVIIKELVEGKEAATKLKYLLENENSFGNLSSDKLAANVLSSFTKALSIITQHGGENGSPVVVVAGNDRKGGIRCYKRRKSAETLTMVSGTTTDIHSWRKYGQKEIMNSKFTRSYFRCKHKHDEGCSATKQVQKTQDNPNMYQITYIGIHTCNTTPKPTQLNKDISSIPPYEACLVNSGIPDLKVPISEQDHHITSPSQTINQEYPKEETPNNVTAQKHEFMEYDENADTLSVFQSLAHEFGDIDFPFYEN